MKKFSQGLPKILVAIAVISLIAAGCGKANNANKNTNSTTNEVVSNTNTPATAVQTKTFNVTGDDFRFNPAEIRVSLGDTVVINFTNPDRMPHDWVIDEIAGAKTKVLDKDQSETITFTADKKGSFEFYCSVGNHRAMGMIGMFIVE